MPHIKNIIKAIPGAKPAYRLVSRLKKRLRRALWEPTKGERYDMETVAVMQRLFSTDTCCIDVGAHCGLILRDIVRLAPQGRHHAVEALPHLAAQLTSKYPQVVVHSCAVGDQSGECKFNYVENLPAYSGIQKRTYSRSDVIITELTVPLRRLDDLIPVDLPVAFIKIDIEGGEYHALRGGLSLLRRCRPTVIFECGPSSAKGYGVTAEMMFDLLHEDAGLLVSTMARWLSSQPPLTREEFVGCFEQRTEYYYIAYGA